MKKTSAVTRPREQSPPPMSLGSPETQGKVLLVGGSGHKALVCMKGFRKGPQAASLFCESLLGFWSNPRETFPSKNRIKNKTFKERLKLCHYPVPVTVNL